MANPRSIKWELFTPVMLALEPWRRRTLRRALGALHERCPLDGRRVLDVGAGTGTLLAELVRYDCGIAAVEPSRSMSRIARARFSRVPVYEEPADKMRSVADGSIDIAILAATLHGFSPSYRERVYAELARVVRTAVAVIDYHANRNPLVAAVEWLEGGDYFDFVKVVDAELGATFQRVERHRLHSYESLYLAWLA